MEVGANTTIDRGSTRDTVIGAGSRLDNLVQIGHNVRLGRCCVIVAQVGIAGSTVLEDFVQVGGQAAMAGHLHIGQGAQIGAQAGVISDVPTGAMLLGSPAQPRKEFFRQVAAAAAHGPAAQMSASTSCRTRRAGCGVPPGAQICAVFRHKSALLGACRRPPGGIWTRSWGGRDHAPQQRHLAKEFLARLRRAAQQHQPPWAHPK